MREIRRFIRLDFGQLANPMEIKINPHTKLPRITKSLRVPNNSNDNNPCSICPVLRLMCLGKTIVMLIDVHHLLVGIARGLNQRNVRGKLLGFSRL